MIDDLFEKARKLPGCVTFPPAEPEQFKTVDSFLSSRKFAALPEDYRKFLRLSNGYIFNGIEFMGTVVHQRIEKRYVFPDIIQINKPYSKYEYFREKMLIGRVSESFIIL